ncbi:MAG TPA: hypothetical protein VFN39_01285 [Gemmatimonadaceae bacterium]|nr:hypothetical protein [Gemmatimonadaceae bacterium]
MADKPRDDDGNFLEYVKAAFRIPGNVMIFGGSLIGALFSPDPMAFGALVLAVEGAYLGMLTAIPGFRLAIDARIAGAKAAEPPAPADWRAIATSLPAASAARFNRLRGRCLEMRRLAKAVQVADGQTSDVVGSLRTSGLDQLLWGFLRLLRQHAALEQLLQQLDPVALKARLAEIEKGLADATAAKDERLVASFTARRETAQARLDYHDRTRKDANFLAAELDRVEDKILALSEMAVNQHDPNVLSAEIDAAASSMQATESSLANLGIVSVATPSLGVPEILDGPTANEPIISGDPSRRLRTR